jgi:1,4-alpha-glucan branching enzyme
MNRVTQDHISDRTADGAAIVVDSAGHNLGVTFKVWGPKARAVFVNGTFNGVNSFSKDQDPDLLMENRGEHWTGFISGAKAGDTYKFFVIGDDGGGSKRDPYARELTLIPPFPACDCIVRDPSSFPWHDAGFRPPAFNEMIVYQLHIGTFARRAGNRMANYLDVIEKLEHLVTLGVNVVQPLPVSEFEATPGLGYDNCDYYSPEMGYQVSDEGQLKEYLKTINRLLAPKGHGPLQLDTIRGGDAQLKMMIDLLHLYGIAVVCDVVYNHGGGFGGFGGIPEDREAIFFWDRQLPGDNNRSLYFTSQTHAGGLGFALFKKEVSDFLVNNALYLLSEFHVDGLRYDEISVLLNLNVNTGRDFCRRITRECRQARAEAIHNAEFWPSECNIVSAFNVVNDAAHGGLGFDARQADGFRDTVRDAIASAANGRGTLVDMDRIAFEIENKNDFRDRWRAVQCVENHDIVYKGRQLRVAKLADQTPNQPPDRTWFSRSRSRVATGLLLTAPGIPQLFMGQEFLEDKQWSDNPDDGLNIFFDGLEDQDHHEMANHVRFTSDLIALRHRLPALASEGVRAFLHHNIDRVIAFQRWVEGVGQDVVVVASLNEFTFYGYRVGFPGSGRWREVFNSDFYDHLPNPIVAGNGGQVFADGPAVQGLPNSASVVIPANGLLVFARE